MGETTTTAPAVTPSLQLIRLPVDKPGPAVEFLKSRSRGVMDLIAHFWERLSLTPPLQRGDLHLVAAASKTYTYSHITNNQLDSSALSGAMLYVPKAHRADVLALDPAAAAAFAAYIAHHGSRNPGTRDDDVFYAGPTFPVADLTSSRPADPVALPADTPSPRNGTSKAAIDFLTGEARGITWMTPYLLPLVHRRAPAKQLVNVVMQLPADVQVETDSHVRLAMDSDIPLLNRWRRLYKEERGIHFDADMDAWVQHQRVFVLEAPVDVKAVTGGDAPKPAENGTSPTAVVAVAKIDLDLQSLVEIGGVFTFPEYRNRGYGASIVRHLAAHIRQKGKVPTLQVDQTNDVAFHLYRQAGWREMGRLARVWLTG